MCSNQNTLHGPLKTSRVLFFKGVIFLSHAHSAFPLSNPHISPLSQTLTFLSSPLYKLSEPYPTLTAFHNFNNYGDGVFENCFFPITPLDICTLDTCFWNLKWHWRWYFTIYKMLYWVIHSFHFGFVLFISMDQVIFYTILFICIVISSSHFYQFVFQFSKVMCSSHFYWVCILTF